MDIKDLNKSQLILLAVLLSFITSIATGITTVTLMQQAPASFTAPVNRVIQQTVEKIQQVEGKTTVQTVVVKEEDLVVDAIAKNKDAVFAVTRKDYDGDGNIIEVPVGRAFAVSAIGMLVADANLVYEGPIYYFKNSSGKFKAEFVSGDKAGFSILKIGEAVNGTDKLNLVVPVFGDLDKMKTGQKVIVLGSSIGSSIFEEGKTLDLSVTKSNTGALVMNLDGEGLGIALLDTIGAGPSFVSIKTISDAVKSIPATP